MRIPEPFARGAGSAVADALEPAYAKVREHNLGVHETGSSSMSIACSVTLLSLGRFRPSLTETSMVDQPAAIP